MIREVRRCCETTRTESARPKIKRAAECVFEVEPDEIGVVSVGDPELPNILIYEAAEGSLGILSQFVDDAEIFRKVVEQAIACWGFRS